MEALGLLGLLALWGAFGLLPWCAALFAARGRGALLALPLAAFAGMAGGALVPGLGAKDALGLAVSLLVATAAGGASTLIAVRYGREMATDAHR